MTVGDLTLDPATRTVLRNNTLVDLTTVEFDLLHTLLSRRGARGHARGHQPARTGPRVRSVRPQHRRRTSARCAGSSRTTPPTTSGSRPSAASDTSMRSLAVKIFLTFWIAQVVILVGLEVMRPRSNVYPPPLPQAVARVHSHTCPCCRRRRVGRCMFSSCAPPCVAAQTRARSERTARGGRSGRACGRHGASPRDEIGDASATSTRWPNGCTCSSRRRNSCSPTSRTNCDRRWRGCRWPSSSRDGKRDLTRRTTSTASRRKGRG